MSIEIIKNNVNLFCTLVFSHYQIFYKEGSNKEKNMVGIEVEKIGVVANTGETSSYGGKCGYLAILGKLYEELGWKITKQKDKFILQLQRGKSLIDLESDGRIELAGAPSDSIHDIAREFRIHQNEISEISNIYGIGWLGTGFQPISKNKDIEDLPEAYNYEAQKLFQSIKEKTGNDRALAWSKKTAGVHAAIDYFSEEDFARKGKLLFRIAPFLMAMFANSPFSKGEFTGYMSYRYHVTSNTGIPVFNITKELYESDFSYEDWCDHIIDQKLLFLQVGDEWKTPEGSFRDYIDHGFEGQRATMDDFYMHMKTLWMDVRLRNTIEFRAIDSLPPSLVPSVAAVMKGLFFQEESLAAVEKLIPQLSFEEYQALQQDSAKHALQATCRGVKLLDTAKELLQIAEEALKKEQIVDFNGRDESQFLEPIKEFVFIKGMSPAEWTVEMWEGEWNNNLFPVLDWYQY
jgi:glutamate--cysteine ligase